MVKSKSLVNYKIRYNPDATKKTKSLEIKDNGVKTTFSIPVVSGDKDIEYQVNEQLEIFLTWLQHWGTVAPLNFNSLVTI